MRCCAGPRVVSAVETTEEGREAAAVSRARCRGGALHFPVKKLCCVGGDTAVATAVTAATATSAATAAGVAAFFYFSQSTYRRALDWCCGLRRLPLTTTCQSKTEPARCFQEGPAVKRGGTASRCSLTLLTRSSPTTTHYLCMNGELRPTVIINHNHASLLHCVR
jgi:hypothetical protein